MIAAIIARLEAKAKPPLTAIGPAESLEALAQGTAPRNGACYVLPFQDRPEESELMSGGFRQSVDVLFLVAFVLRRHDDAKGGKKAGSYDVFREAIETALFGWRHDDDASPCELVAGRAASLGNGVTIYVQTWRTDRMLSVIDDE